MNNSPTSYTNKPKAILNLTLTHTNIRTIINTTHQTQPPTKQTQQEWLRQHTEWILAGKQNVHLASNQDLQDNAEHYERNQT